MTAMVSSMSPLPRHARERVALPAVANLGRHTRRPGQAPVYTAVYTPVASTDFRTGADGLARVGFTPPEPGAYQVDVYGLDPQDQNARTEVLLWVAGPGEASWPDLPNQRFEITTDKDSYIAGDTAKIFIPNPFVTNSLALVTMERGIVSKAEVIQLSGSGDE